MRPRLGRTGAPNAGVGELSRLPSPPLAAETPPGKGPCDVAAAGILGGVAATIWISTAALVIFYIGEASRSRRGAPVAKGGGGNTLHGVLRSALAVT